MAPLVLRIFIKNRHQGDDNPKGDDAGGDQENGDADFHPVGKVPIGGRQVPVEGDDPYVQPVYHETQHGPNRSPLDQLQIFLTNPHRIKETGQGHKP